MLASINNKGKFKLKYLPNDSPFMKNKNIFI